MSCLTPIWTFKGDLGQSEFKFKLIRIYLVGGGIFLQSWSEKRGGAIVGGRLPPTSLTGFWCPVLFEFYRWEKLWKGQQRERIEISKWSLFSPNLVLSQPSPFAAWAPCVMLFWPSGRQILCHTLSTSSQMGIIIPQNSPYHS